MRPETPFQGQLGEFKCNLAAFSRSTSLTRGSEERFEAVDIEDDATYEKPVKAYVFLGFAHVRSGAHDATIDRKSLRTRFSNELRNGSPSNAAFFDSEASKWCPEGCLGRLWALLSGSWRGLGRSWRALGRSWGALGALLGCSWPLLGPSRRSWDTLGEAP